MKLLLIMLLMGMPCAYAFGLGVSPGNLSIENEAIIRIYNPLGSELELQLKQNALDYKLQKQGEWTIARLSPKKGNYKDTLIIQKSSGAIAGAIEVPVHVRNHTANPLIGLTIITAFIGLGLLVQRFKR